MQIWPLSSAPCLSYLSVPPCTDPSTRPHIQGSDVQATCRLNFWYYYFPFWVFALWNVVASRPFSPCSWLDPPSLSHSVGLTSLVTCRCQSDLYLLSFSLTGSTFNSSKISSLLLWPKSVYPAVLKIFISIDVSLFFYPFVWGSKSRFHIIEWEQPLHYILLCLKISGPKLV